ncbi:MAG: sulfatase-like hydrolase/transferase [Fibrobacteraceae bacterium]
MNPFILITSFAIILQSLMLVLFYALPDSLGLSLTEMFSGKTVWQVSMAFGAILVISSIFAFLKKPRLLALFFIFYFFIAIVDYELFRFSHQRLSYSFLRTYFHFSNITDSTTISILGGDLKGTILWLILLFVSIAGCITFVVFYSLHKKNNVKTNIKVPVLFGIFGLIFSVIPLILFLSGTRGIKTIPVINAPVDMRFTLGKHTLTAPILHIAAEETFEFVLDDYEITDDLIDDLDAFLPSNFAQNRPNAKEYPAFRNAPLHEYKAKKPYNIVFVFGESYKGRIFNQMLDGDTTLAPNLWKLASGKMFLEGGGGLWFKNAFSGGYPTVRGTMATYLGFPSHPDRDVPSFYASNHFTGFPEFLTNYVRAYMTVSNPVFDHTLPFVEKFYGKNWYLPEEPQIAGTSDSLGMDLTLHVLEKMPTDSTWFLTFNTIASHIPFYGYPDAFAPKTDDAMERYRNAIRYTDTQFGRFLSALAARPDFKRTVIVILGDHDSPVDSVDYVVPQPLGVSASRIFMGIFSADSNLFKGLDVREDVASQLDIGPTILDLAQVKVANHFWGYDLLTEKRPAEQPSLFFTQGAYYLGFRGDSVLTGGLSNEDVFKGKKGSFSLAHDSLSLSWRDKAIGTSKVLRSLLRNDKMEPQGN